MVEPVRARRVGGKGEGRGKALPAVVVLAWPDRAAPEPIGFAAPVHEAAIAPAESAPRTAVIEPEAEPPEPTVVAAPAELEEAPVVTAPLERQPVRAPSRAHPAAQGLVSINTVPWSEVLVDGRSIGTTPLAEVSVEAGRHALTSWTATDASTTRASRSPPAPSSASFRDLRPAADGPRAQAGEPASPGPS